MHDDIISIDDAEVIEVRDALAKPVTTRDLDALDRSLKLRGLTAKWDRITTDAEGYNLPPSLGHRWDSWFDELTSIGLTVTPVLSLLADAGILGTNWNEDARELVWRVRGWT